MVEDGVCVVTHPLAPAGENATRSLLAILTEITSVCLVTADLPADSVIRDRYDVIEFSAKGAGQDLLLVAVLRFAVNQLRMSAAIVRRDERIVLFFGGTSYLLPILVAKAVGRTVVLQPRGDVPLTLGLSWSRRLPPSVARVLAHVVRTLESVGYRLADGIITYTPAMAEGLGLDRYREKLYPHGARFVDTTDFHPRGPFADRDCVVGFLGRLDEEKGISELASVAKRLPEDVTFVFAGDGALRGWLEAELATEIEAGAVKLTGWVDHDDVPELLSEWRLLVLPSAATEGLPTVILEALACGTPAYASAVSGVPDVVRDGETGELIEVLDPAVMADDIVDLLNSDELAVMSKRGRELVQSEFTFEAAVDRYRRILDQL